MAKKSKTPELSESELRRLLLDKRRADRARRLQAFTKSGELLSVDAQRAERAEGDPLRGLKVHEAPELKLKSPTLSSRRSWVDRMLLAVELLAAAGLIYIFFDGLSVLNMLNREFAEAFAVPSNASPTPLMGPVVLPSGHTPPTAGQPAQPNEAEIPEHLRPQVQAYMAAIEIPTPGPQQALGIRVEAIGVNAPIVQGDGWEELKRGVGQHIGSANPGQAGNLVLTGHNDIYGEVFRDLDQLEEGDEIVIYSANNNYTYVVAETRIVEPTEVEVMEATPNATLTLISCYPYRVDTQRIAVFAELKE
ncbi:MAG: sortase [Chloroflexi bacterium]|nr:sortase [Chloroflexota bacterium]